MKRFSIEKVPFADVYKETLKVFEKERLSSIKSYRMQVESNTINLSAPYEHLPKLDQCVTELQFVLGRYGVKVARSNSKVLKDSEGKPYRVYMMASANKFLRIYYASVKAYLDSLEHN